MERKFWLRLELVHCTLNLNPNADVGSTASTGYILGVCNVKNRRVTLILNQTTDHI